MVANNKQLMLYCLQETVSRLPVGVLVVDREGNVFIYNRKMGELEGLAPELVLGKHITEVFNHDHPAREILTVLKYGQPIIDAYRRYFNDQGREINLITSTYPVIKQDQVVASVAIARTESLLNYIQKRELQWLDQPVEHLAASPNGTSYTLSHFLGTSQAADSVRKQAVKAAASSCPVLISGEPGTGKEIIAQGIHNLSRFRDEPYMAINCAALPTGMLEEVLFGSSASHAEEKSRAGLIKQARRGSLFLDQVDKMGLPEQSRLLQALQEKHLYINRSGDPPDEKVGCRIISAISSPPDVCFEYGQLRKDLYFQLAGEVINIPPLRQRKADIFVLADYYLQKYSQIYSQGLKQFSSELIPIFEAYPWPGNVRELAYVIEVAVNLAEGEQDLKPGHLPPYLRSKLIRVQPPAEQNAAAGRSAGSTSPGHYLNTDEHRPPDKYDGVIDFKSTGSNLNSLLQEFEKQVIWEGLVRNKGNITQTALELGLARQNLQYRIKKLKITGFKPD